jgi:hypothetical protein
MGRALGRCLILEDIGVCRRFAASRPRRPSFPRGDEGPMRRLGVTA